MKLASRLKWNDIAVRHTAADACVGKYAIQRRLATSAGAMSGRPLGKNTRPANRPPPGPRKEPASTGEGTTSVTTVCRAKPTSIVVAMARTAVRALSVKSRQSEAFDDDRRPAARIVSVSGAPLLAQARLHQLRRAGRTDFDEAPRAGREAGLDLRAPLSARAQLLRAAARARGDPAAIYISWLLHGVRGAMSRVLKNAVLFGIAALAFIGIFFFDVGFPWIVLAAAILGAIAAFVAWFPFKIDITKVIGACALIGLAHSLAT